MEITWLGRTCFRLKGRERTVLTDPCPPSSGYRIGKQQADVVTLSRRDDDAYSYLDGLSGAPRVLDAPGEYEVGGVLLTGIAMKRPDGLRNVAFIVEIDGVKIAHLGVPQASTPSLLDDFKGVDVLLLPVGGGQSLAAAAAADVMTTIEPRVAVPMHYRTDGETSELDTIDKFLKETAARPEPQPRLTVTRSQLPSDLTVMVLQPRA